MKSRFEQLQTEAIDRNARTSDLLRKAYLVASKLNIPGVPEWIDKELSGYEAQDKVPPYRKLRGRVMARTYHGWKPVQFPTSEFEAQVAEQSVHQSMAALEGILAEEGDPRINFPPEGQQILQEVFQLETEFTCMHSRASLAAIIDEVRTRILRWSTELDKAGIKGDGLTFTQQEKNVAHNILVQGVLNVGVVGDVYSATNIAVGDRARAGSISFEEIEQLIAAVVPHFSSGPTVDKDELLGAVADLRNSSTGGRVEVAKAQTILRRMLRIVGKIGDHVLAAGIRVVVEGWMKTHGMVP